MLKLCLKPRLLLPVFSFLLLAILSFGIKNSYAYTFFPDPVNTPINGNLTISLTNAEINPTVAGMGCATYGFRLVPQAGQWQYSSQLTAGQDGAMVFNLPNGTYSYGIGWTCNGNYSGVNFWQGTFIVDNSIPLPVVVVPPTGAVVMPATDALGVIGGAVVNSSVDMSTSVFANFWPYFLILSVLFGLVYLAKRFIRIGRGK